MHQFWDKITGDNVDKSDSWKADTKHHPTECMCCDFKIRIGNTIQPRGEQSLEWLPSQLWFWTHLFFHQLHTMHTLSLTPLLQIPRVFLLLKSHFLPREIKHGSFSMYLLSEMTLFSENQMSLPVQSLVGKLPFSNRGSHFVCHF